MHLQFFSSSPKCPCPALSYWPAAAAAARHVETPSAAHAGGKVRLHREAHELGLAGGLLSGPSPHLQALRTGALALLTLLVTPDAANGPLLAIMRQHARLQQT